MKMLSQGYVDELNVRKKGLKDCYKWHCGLWEVLSVNDDRNSKKEIAFLFRVDRQPRGNRVLVLSDEEPADADWINWQKTRIEPGFLEATQYRFQFKANPTVKRKKTDGSGGQTKNGRRTGIYKHTELMQWMERKAEQSGFKIEGQLDYAGPVDEFFVRKGCRGKLVSVDFRGVLRVVDHKLFKDAFEKGIGSAKGFGFGMLMLQPVS